MPIIKRLVEPVNVARTTGQVAVARSELPGMANHCLANVILQMSSLSKQADDIFTELTLDVTGFVQRMQRLEDRVRRLSVKMEQLDRVADDVSLDQIKQRKHFRSQQNADQQILAERTRPICIQEVYKLNCEPPPPLDLMNQYREDGKDAMKFYTDPMFFFELWRRTLEQDAQLGQRDRNGVAQAKQQAKRKRRARAEGEQVAAVGGAGVVLDENGRPAAARAGPPAPPGGYVSPAVDGGAFSVGYSAALAVQRTNGVYSERISMRANGAAGGLLVTAAQPVGPLPHASSAAAALTNYYTTSPYDSVARQPLPAADALVQRQFSQGAYIDSLVAAQPHYVLAANVSETAEMLSRMRLESQQQQQLAGHALYDMAQPGATAVAMSYAQAAHQQRISQAAAQRGSVVVSAGGVPVATARPLQPIAQPHAQPHAHRASQARPLHSQQVLEHLQMQSERQSMMDGAAGRMTLTNGYAAYGRTDSSYAGVIAVSMQSQTPISELTDGVQSSHWPYEPARVGAGAQPPYQPAKPDAARVSAGALAARSGVQPAVKAAPAAAPHVQRSQSVTRDSAARGPPPPAAAFSPNDGPYAKAPPDAPRAAWNGPQRASSASPPPPPPPAQFTQPQFPVDLPWAKPPVVDHFAPPPVFPLADRAVAPAPLPAVAAPPTAHTNGDRDSASLNSNEDRPVPNLLDDIKRGVTLKRVNRAESAVESRPAPAAAVDRRSETPPQRAAASRPGDLMSELKQKANGRQLATQQSLDSAAPQVRRFEAVAVETTFVTVATPRVAAAPAAAKAAPSERKLSLQPPPAKLFDVQSLMDKAFEMRRRAVEHSDDSDDDDRSDGTGWSSD